MNRRRLLRQGGAGLATLGLAACSALDHGAPRFEFHVIEDLRADPTPAEAAARIDRVLLLTTSPTQALYDSDRIAFTSDGKGRSYYQYSNWSERPARRVLTLTETRLARRGAFRSVASSLSGVRGDLVLGLRLDELLHDDSRAPGTLRLGVTAELIEWRSRTMVGRRSFARQVPVPTRDANGAARAADEAVTALLDELVPWVEASARGAVR